MSGATQTNPFSVDELTDLVRLLVRFQRGQAATSEALSQLSAQVSTSHTTLITEIRTMSDAFSAEQAKLQADVAAQGTVIASAITAFQGITAQLAAAEAAAKNAGATDAQVASIAAVRQGLETNTATLAAAIPANTPAATDTTGGTTAPTTATNAPSGTGTAL